MRRQIRQQHHVNATRMAQAHDSATSYPVQSLLPASKPGEATVLV